MLQAVIMAGGSGTRFWPLSRQALPKQFLTIHRERSLLQQAADRIAGLVGNDGITIVTGSTHVEQTRRQLPDVPVENIIGEPMGRDTAPCIALAAELLYRKNAASQTIVLAADHLIEPTELFHQAVQSASTYLDKHPEALVTFGVPPQSPSTGYGYLRRGERMTSGDGPAVFRLKSFHEKPNLATAQEFLASGEYYWNSGIFVWNTKAILDELSLHAPSIRSAVERIADAWGTPTRDEVFRREFEALPKKSIDYAVMEHARHVAMVEVPFSWDDVGSWLALERVGSANAEGNIVRGEHLGIESAGCIVVGEKGHLIATIGVQDLIIVQTADVTLVAKKSDEQAVKQLQQMLAERGYGPFA